MNQPIYPTRPPAILVAPGVWHVPATTIPGKLFIVRLGPLGLSCDCPSPRALCWHVEQVRAALARARLG